MAGPVGGTPGPARASRRLLDACDRPSGDTIRASREVGPDEPFFAGHFPSLPVAPGVFLVEALAECGRRLHGDRERALRLVEVEAVRFRRRVSPGDRLDLTVTRAGGSSVRPRFTGAVRVGGRPAVEARFTLAVSG